MLTKHDRYSCNWARRTTANPRAPAEYLLLIAMLLLLLYAAATSTPPAVVRIGGLFPAFRTSSHSFARSSDGPNRLTAFLQAIREINDKSDGVADDLLPSTTLQFSIRDSKLDAPSSFVGARELVEKPFVERRV